MIERKPYHANCNAVSMLLLLTMVCLLMPQQRQQQQQHQLIPGAHAREADERSKFLYIHTCTPRTL
jgi:hypothetical protein